MTTIGDIILLRLWFLLVFIILMMQLRNCRSQLVSRKVKEQSAFCSDLNAYRFRAKETMRSTIYNNILVLLSSIIVSIKTWKLRCSYVCRSTSFRKWRFLRRFNCILAQTNWINILKLWYISHVRKDMFPHRKISLSSIKNVYGM